MLDKNDCIDDYTVDEHNLWFLQGEPDERQPNYCIPVFLRDTVMLIGGADRADSKKMAVLMKLTLSYALKKI